MNIANSLLAVIASLTVTAQASAADLTVYTYDSFVSEWGPGPQLEKAFEQRCGCDLDFIAAEDGVSILNRLRIEGGSTKADVILGIDDGLLEETRKAGLVQPHGIDLKGLKPELQWRDKEFVPFDYGYFSFIYNSDKLGTPATSLKALIDSEASVIYQDPRTSTPGQGLMMWVKSVYGDQAPAAWKRLADHTVTVTKGWWEAYSMFLEGDADYVLSYSTSPAYHQVAEQKSQFKAALFQEGHVAQVEVAAINAGSDNLDHAREFLQFLISPEAQAIIPVTNWMLPVIPDVELPAAFDQLIQPERIGFSPETMATHRKQWVREWRNAVSQ